MRLKGFLLFAIIFSAGVIVFSSAVLWVGMHQHKRAAQNHDSNVFYEIFVRSFYDSNGDGIGDINGITHKLDYLQSLGISGIWLTPINPSPSYHGYDVTDYYGINSKYGTMEDFERLLAEAHKRNIQIVMDLVVNHTSSEHPWFIESAKAADSPKRDWYVWADDKTNVNGASAIGGKAWHYRNGGHYLGIFWEGMPDLNMNHSEVRSEIIKIGQFWLNKGVDGFRLDAAKHVYEDFQGQSKQPQIAAKNVEWWQAFRSGLDEVNKEAYLVGEVWDTTSVIGPYLDHAFNGSFNFDLAGQILSAVKSEKAADIGFTLNRIHQYYAKVSEGKFEDALFLSNHDQNRVMSQLQGNVNHAKMAASILLTLPGRPYIYYGEEIGMQGMKPDESIREPIVWYEDIAGGTGQTTWEPQKYNRDGKLSVEAQTEDEGSLLNHYRKLIQLRKQVTELRGGEIQSFPVSESGIMAYVRFHEDDMVLVLHNLTSESVQVDLAAGSNGKYSKVISASADGVGIGKGTIKIPGYTTVLLR